MNLSVVITKVENTQNLSEYLEKLAGVCERFSQNFEFLIVSKKKLEITSNYDVRFFCIDDDDIQKSSMCGVDNAKYDEILLTTPQYTMECVEKMLIQKQNGVEIVCVKHKISKLANFFKSIISFIYNFILKFYGDGLFSLGIKKDIQLISGETVQLMKENQTLAYRLRTMYAPNVYKTAFVETKLQGANFEAKRKQSILLPLIFSILLAIGFIGGLIAMILLKSPFIAYFLVCLGFAILEFILLSIMVHAYASIEIGGLYKPYRNGKIYKYSQANN